MFQLKPISPVTVESICGRLGQEVVWHLSDKPICGVACE